MDIFWTPKARAEREGVIDYIARENLFAALDQLDKIEQQTSLLAGQAKMGRPGRVKGTRELVVSGTPFIAICRVKGKRIEVLRFLHGAQKVAMKLAETSSDGSIVLRCLAVRRIWHGNTTR